MHFGAQCSTEILKLLLFHLSSLPKAEATTILNFKDVEEKTPMGFLEFQGCVVPGYEENKKLLKDFGSVM